MTRRPTRWRPGITLISIVAVAVLVLVAWIATRSVPDPRPATTAAAEGELTEVFDQIEQTLPADMVLASTQSSEVEGCVTGSGGDEVHVRRLVDLDPALDRVAWVNALGTEFTSADGWEYRGPQYRTEPLRAKLVDRRLLVTYITASIESGSPRVILRSTSRCTQPG
ncbi:hypothetical protein GCM10009819_10740 [Agromyces tropicus]|uniref:Uncharacterized protein n=1 Tax=Agromyces tropicus TaxID=555371 RepID=A0ABN2U716_9MICO